MRYVNSVSSAKMMIRLCLLTVALVVAPRLAAAGDAYARWPVPESYDIRGMYCDYRDTDRRFHKGIDIYGPGGCQGLKVYPVVPAMEVMAARLDENDMFYIPAWDYYNTSDRFRYCHVEWSQVV